MVKILDFGVSKQPIANDLTREGQIVGTPQYLAPEQIEGKAVPQTDQYAIGVMLYMCLTKTLPYQAHAGFRLLRAIGVGEFAPPRTLRTDLPQKLEEVILRAMRAAPENRFDSVHALGRALLEFSSPQASAQWRAYYLADPQRAPPKASTHAIPLVEAMARGLAAERADHSPRALAPTATAAPGGGERTSRPSRAQDATAPFAATPGTPVTVEEPVPDAAQRAPGPDDARPVAVPAPGSRRAGPRRLTAAALIAGILALAAVGWSLLRRPAGVEAPKAVAPTAPIAPDPGAHREAQSARRTPGPPSTQEAAPPSSPHSPAEKQHRPSRQRPASEHKDDGSRRPPDGIPIMP